MPTEFTDRDAARLAESLANYLRSIPEDDHPLTVADLATDLLGTVPVMMLADETQATLDAVVDASY